MTADPAMAALDALLRSHDDPDWHERPATFHYRQEQVRFANLVEKLEQQFASQCWHEAGFNIQDASYLGDIVIPETATTHGIAIFIRVSNFGGMVTICPERPGCYDDEEMEFFIAEQDRRRIQATLSDLGYVAVSEWALWRKYDGTIDGRGAISSRVPSTWFTRYFDYL